MDHLQGNTSCKNQNIHLGAQFNEQNKYDAPKHGIESKPGEEPGSPSSSSDTSSDDDLFQLDTSKFSKSSTAPPQPEQKTHLTTEVAQNSTTAVVDPTAGYQVGNLRNNGSGFAGSPHLDQVPTQAHLPPNFSGGKPPPVQTMGKSDVSDPNRIPSAIFARTNTNSPMEWSVASNESLFSIHMGNSSFSRDQAFLLARSQELGNFSSSPLAAPSPIPPSTGTVPMNMRTGRGLAQPGVAEATNAEAMHDVLRAAAEERADKDRFSAEGGARSTSTSRPSDGSVCSFAFPILTGEGKGGSTKVITGHQPLLTEQPDQPSSPSTKDSKENPGSAEKKWFSCFSCCALC